MDWIGFNHKLNPLFPLPLVCIHEKLIRPVIEYLCAKIIVYYFQSSVANSQVLRFMHSCMRFQIQPYLNKTLIYTGETFKFSAKFGRERCLKILFSNNLKIKNDQMSWKRTKSYWFQLERINKYFYRFDCIW